ncbi:MAG: DUF3108 domain-containing protein [Candidatus Omnitrophica bacterium]|nr:DUF3108 domain-containing protein [Candidatus Omnitrophota bacterium]
MIRVVLMAGVVFMLAQGVVSAEQQAPFTKGETITYDIKKLGMTVGKMVLTYKGFVELDDRELELVIFEASALNFDDTEQIYLDPETFRPVVVKREVNLWGKKELIEERYARDSGKVTVTKRVDGTETTQIIEKTAPLDNIYGFLYFYRKKGEFRVGENMDLCLPTKDIQIKLLRKEFIKAGGEKKAAYYLESDPSEYKLWFDQSEQRIPLRIDGAIGFGKTAMVMSSYQEGE